MKNKNTLWLLTAVAMLLGFQGMAQTNVNMPFNTGQVTFTINPAANVCSFNFFDNGGSAANYSNNSSYLTSVVTFAPSNPANKIQATFSSFNTEASFDALYVRDGNTTASTLIPSANGGTLGGTPAGGFWGTVAPNNIAANVVRATAANATGALTFQFESDASVTLAGWAATVVEVPVIACAMTAPANLTVSTSATTCDANVTTATPVFNPAGCAASFTFQYRVNGGAPVVLAQPLPATITLNGIPKGVNTITYQLVNACGGGLVATATQTITVNDVVAPVITCPSNVTLNLGPGECTTAYSYTVGVTDNCPFFGPTQTLVHPSTAPTVQNQFNGVTFDVRNDGTTPINITSFQGPFVAGVHTIKVWYTTSAASAIGNLTNPGAWTLLGTAVVNDPGGAWFDLTNIPVGGLQLAPGQSKGIYIESNLSMNYNNGNATTTNGTLSIISNNHGAGAANFGNTFVPRMFVGSVSYQTVASGSATQTAGLPSGAEFPLGTTVNSFKATDAAGNMATCSFSVTVKEYPNAITSLSCNNLINVSLNEQCTATINADQVLEGGPYRCYDNYVVEVDKIPPFNGLGPWVPAVLGPSDVGKTYQVRVTDPVTGNKCWGSLKVEDKFPPVLVCTPTALPCNFPTDPSFSQAAQLTLRYGSNCVPATLNDFQTVECLVPVSAPAGATVNDLDLRVRMDGDVWFFNIAIEVESPSGTIVAPWTQIGGCGAEPLFVRFDDEGNNTVLCTDYTTDQNAIPFPGQGVLSDFDGEVAAGTWKIRFRDVDGFGDVSTISIAELYINLQGTFTAGFPNNLVFPTQVSQLGPNTYRVAQGTGTPVVEYCSDVTLTYIDQEVTRDCASGLTATINRKWTAVDASGNSSTCTQVIDLLRPSLTDVVAPPDYDDIDQPAFECDFAGYPTPDAIEQVGLQGYPYVFGVPEGCSINWTYLDHVIDVCDGTYKIRRQWSIIDWCIGDGFEYNQIIKVLDDEGPAISCPANVTVSTDPYTCCATAQLPDVIIEDNCSRINNISAMVIGFDQATNQQIGMFQVDGFLGDFAGNNYWDLDTMATFELTPCLPIGTHTVVLTAEDDCGNTSTCSYRLTVRDYTAPIANCIEFTTISLGVDDPFDCYGPAGPGGVPAALGPCEFGGVSWAKATSFNDQSYDNCANIRFTIRRMPNAQGQYSDCIQSLNSVNGRPACNDFFQDIPSEFERAINENDSIKFYCCEAGTEQMVILRVYQLDPLGNIAVGLDGTPLYNECMVTVEVQDKLKPVCISPANVTVNCENFDNSLWAYGKATIYDNCCLDTTISYQNQCGMIHTVSYANFDTVCNKGTITRTFRARDCHGFTSQCTQRVVVTYSQDYFVQFPNDVIVTFCDSSGVYGQPTFFDKDCELLAVSFEDEVFTVVPDACFKIERTWHIINWCSYNPNLPLTYVPNPEPNATVNNPANLPGPRVSACGTPAPWNPTVVALTPGTTPVNYCTYYTPNGNGYEYKQIIKIVDTQDPVVANCPASPVEFCDLTVNNAELWNEMYWWDNIIGSHDLCEGPTDLNLTATDFCSGANININYLLFLDLDADGTMETVINSKQPQTSNQVLYNNANTPNFTGGTARAFDQRPVPLNQKYRFALQTTTSGKNRTAAVRWNTIQSPTNFVIPELPYGTHKIKWFVEDGCGNETVCEYTFIVKDCKKPTIICYNGLAVNIMPTGMITVWASDFLKEKLDNCTPADQIKIGIRKSGAGTGFPVDGAGNPITSVTFTCNELGTQLVELWGIDKAGNADFCETYLLVQDNMGNCPNGKANIAGAVATENVNGIEEGQLQLSGSSNAIPNGKMLDMSDVDGKYNFNAIPTLNDYLLTPEKDDNWLNGVTTYDLVLISRHILGLELLNSPYKMIAADANKSGSITSFDIVELRKLILGVYQNGLPANTSWRFVDKSYKFTAPNNPFKDKWPESITIAQINAHLMDENFVGMKIGDVNGSVQANSKQTTQNRSVGTLLVDVQDRAVKAGEIVEVAFTAAEAVEAYQFTLNTGALEVVDIVPGAEMDASNFAVFNDEHAVTTSFDGKSAGSFTVRFRATQSGQLSNLLAVSSRITPAVAYNAQGENLEVALRFNGQNGSTISGVGFELYQNQPNPWISKTMIGFHLPEAADATLTILDETGRVLFQQSGAYNKGYNAVAIDRAVLNTTGVLYYKVETATHSATKKMIQTK